MGAPSQGADNMAKVLHRREGSVQRRASNCVDDEVEPFAIIRRGERPEAIADGACSRDGRVAGTYLHGIFDADAFRHTFIRAARAARRLAPPERLAPLSAKREARIDRLAAHVRASLDVPAILSQRPNGLSVSSS